jgi:ankyrin repeat protein
MFASRIGNTSLAKILISKGANPSLKNPNGDSAFLIAAKNGHFEVMEYINFIGAGYWNETN